MAHPSEASHSLEASPHFVAKDLTTRCGNLGAMRDPQCKYRNQKIFIITNGSECATSTGSRRLAGLGNPANGKIVRRRLNFAAADSAARKIWPRRLGIPNRNTLRWSSMAVAYDVGLSLGEFTGLAAKETPEVAALRLLRVQLARFGDLCPSEISAETWKRTGLAHANAFDPATLFLGKPLAGPQPLSSPQLDDLGQEDRTFAWSHNRFAHATGGTPFHDCGHSVSRRPSSKSERRGRSSSPQSKNRKTLRIHALLKPGRARSDHHG